MNTGYKIYKRRWLMLAVFMFMIAINQLLWITFAPITGQASAYYAVSDLKIGILSMCFMIVYLIVSIPASWIIDRYGIRAGVGTGAVFTGVFGILRSFAGDDYNLLLFAQTGIAIGQPFILNAITKVAARWFPIDERATASGLGTLSMYFGILAGMTITPYLTANSGIQGMLNIYGMLAVLISLIFLILIKERPPSPPCSEEMEERALVIDGMKQIFNSRDFIWLSVIFFIGLGVFNSVTTWIEDIIRPRGFSAAQAGITGGAMILGGIIGALVIPVLSDRYKRRTPFITLALIGATAGLTGITFASNYFILLTSGAVLGFFLLSSGPIGFQYGAEITYPISEGTSNGFLLLSGQISGIAFIFAMDSFKSPDGSMTRSLVVLIILMVLSILMSFMLKESALLGKARDGGSQG
jgi:cyanate permease